MFDDIRSRFIILKLALLAASFVAGYYMSKSESNKAYWKYSLIFILIFGIVEGMRFGRMGDWNLYYLVYQDLGKGLSRFYEPIFVIICKFFYSICFPYWLFIFVQCIFLIASCCLVLKKYKSVAFWALPSLVSLLYMNENFIRWYLACSFLLIAIYFIQKDDSKKIFIFSLIAMGCHSGTIVFIPFLIFYKVLSNKIIHEYVYATLFLVFTFAMHITQMQILVQIADFLVKCGFGDFSHVGSYLSTAQLLINGEGASGSGISEGSLLNKIRLCIVFLPVILLVPQYLKEYKLGFFFYNLFCFGVILNPVFLQVEILGRISGFFSIFYFIVGAIAYYHIIALKKERLSIRLMALLSFFCGFSPAISLAFQTLKVNDMMFIWDAGNLEYLPIQNWWEKKL